LDVFWEEVPVQIGFAASEQVEIVGSDKVLDFSYFGVVARVSRKAPDVAKTDAKGGVGFWRWNRIAKG